MTVRSHPDAGLRGGLAGLEAGRRAARRASWSRRALSTLLVAPLLAACVGLSSTAFGTTAGTTAVTTEAVPPMSGPSPDGIYEATLENGLKILMKEVRTAPLMCVSVWYRGGTMHEAAGTSGLAHLLEHMMFKGTAKYGKGVFDQTLEANGAINNATTWLDRTNYFILTAKEKTDLALELEADRMRGALFTQQDLEDEMPVVRNEMEIGEDDSWDELDERIGSIAILEHPYHRPTIGWKSEVEAITAAQIHEFYDRYYWPNNAYLVLVGDLPAEEMLAKATHHFSAVPAGPEPPPIVTVEPPQKGERRLLIREAGQNRLLGMAFRVPEQRHPDTVALDLLGRILAGGKSSRLYRALVEGGLATEVHAYNQGSMQDPYLFFVYAFLHEDAVPDDAENRIYEVIEALWTEPPTAAEVARAQKQTQVERVFGRDELISLMFEIGEAESSGGYDYSETYLDAVAAVQPEDLTRVARTYLHANARTVGLYLPNGEEGGSWTSRPGDPSRAQGRVTPQRAASGAPSDDVSRSAPRVATQGTLRVPAFGKGPASQDGAVGGGVAVDSSVLPQRFELANGAVLLVQESRENPTVSMRIRIDGGLLLEEPEKAGLAEMTAKTMLLGTLERSASELNELLESNGISISAWSTSESVEMSASALAQDFPVLLDLLGEIVTRPAFSADQIEVARSQVASALREELQNTYSLAYHRALGLLYGEDSAYARLTEGTEPTLESLGAEDLRGFHRELLHGARWSIAIVGDVDAADARRRIDAALADLPRGEECSVAPPQPRSAALDGQIHRLPVPDKSQVDLVFVGTGVAPDAANFRAAELANVVLGGSFTSRLNGRLRDDEGLTYGASSFFVHRTGSSHWVATLGVNPENVEQALQSVQRELRKIRAEGVQEEEYRKAREYTAGSFPMGLQSKGAVARELLHAERYGLGLDYIAQFSARVRALDADAVDAAARRTPSPEQLIVVVAGTFDEDQGTRVPAKETTPPAPTEGED